MKLRSPISDYQQTGPYPGEIPTLLTHSPGEVVWWYPNLMRDGFDLIDPNSVGARDWANRLGNDRW